MVTSTPVILRFIICGLLRAKLINIMQIWSSSDFSEADVLHTLNCFNLLAASPPIELQVKFWLPLHFSQIHIIIYIIQ